MTEAFSTKEIPGEFDAIETAKPGEILFTLQGGDPLAPLVVMVWAWKARRLAREMDDEKAAEKLLRKATNAEGVAWAMKEQQNGERPIEGENAKYGSPDDDAPVAPTNRAKLIASVVALRNAAAAVMEASEASEGEEALSLAADALDLNLMADRLEPRRGNERS